MSAQPQWGLEPRNVDTAYEADMSATEHFEAWLEANPEHDYRHTESLDAGIVPATVRDLLVSNLSFDNAAVDQIILLTHTRRADLLAALLCTLVLDAVEEATAEDEKDAWEAYSRD